jgi:hypothetical protein
MTDPPRPWCFPCYAHDGSRVFAAHLGLACEWHWGILSASEQEDARRAVAVKHPRGGALRSVIEQIFVVRRDLRENSTVEQTWAAEFRDLEAEVVAQRTGKP